MRLAAVAVIGMLVGLAATSCSVNRRSAAFACDRDDDCDDDRACVRGYCTARAIVSPPPTTSGCPAGCTTCDLDDKTCDIECGILQPCARAICPAGFSCTIGCTAPGACNDVDCTSGTDCEITCFGADACGTIRCGEGACDVSCIGKEACGLLDCGRSCRCDQVCADDTACGASLCPLVPAGICSEQGNAAAACDSTDTRGCSRCD